ncbi:MAG: class I tRNA ligase family protein, partial [Planctomycetes bacterium]|nr:class I tRNA ligase family protein [Planctomycetota bacterium]
AIVGARRFLDRVWRLVGESLEALAAVTPYTGDGADLSGPAKAVWRKTHQTVRKVTADIDQSWQFNTAVAAVMELTNALADLPRTPEAAPVLGLALETTVRLLAPFVPHVAEELWEALGHEPSVLAAGWPEFSEAACREDEVEIAIQVNGKLRAHLTVAAGAPEDAVREAALANDRVKDAIGAATVRKVIVIPGRLVNIVAK